MTLEKKRKVEIGQELKKLGKDFKDKKISQDYFIVETKELIKELKGFKLNYQEKMQIKAYDKVMNFLNVLKK